MKNIVLIGMPGAGKSTIGVVLAKIFGYRFIDSDLEIQSREGDVLENLIQMHGIEGFLAIENDVNKNLKVSRSVIATGGSACYCDEALRVLGKDGVIVYLKADYPTLRRRLGSLKARGVVIRKGSTLLDLYHERTPLYEKYADLTVDVAGCPLKTAIRRTAEALKECEKFNEA